MSDTNSSVVSAVSVPEPEIQKTNEYEMVLKLIDKGIWRTANLSKAVGVDPDTIATWKKTDRVKKAYSEAVLKFAGRRKDAEKILGELEVESTPDVPQVDARSITIINYASVPKLEEGNS